MRVGGRRSPPLTRKSKGDDVPHFETPPQRVNAGYNAVNRGPDGKFMSFHDGPKVQQVVAAINNRAKDCLEGGSASMEEVLRPSIEAKVACDEVDSGVEFSKMQVFPACGVPNMGLFGQEIGEDSGKVWSDSHPLPTLSQSPTSCMVGGCINAMDLEGPNNTLNCPAAVCSIANKKNSCTSADFSSLHKNSLVSSPCPTPSPSLGGVGGDSIDMDKDDPSSNLMCGPAVCENVNKENSCMGARNSVWTKPGVTPLPSLKDLPHLSPKDGVAQLDVEESNIYLSRFDAALVGRLFGRHIPFYHLQIELQRRWDRFGSFRLITLSNECFICFFSDVKARDAVLMGGPWNIAGQVLGLDRWTPGFSPSTQHGFITPVWVRFPELPFYCWGVKNLASISSILGEPLWVDDATLGMTRGSFARVCIKINLLQPLVPSVWVQGMEGPFKQQVEYEGLTSFCTKCGRVGHKNLHCNPTLAAGGRPETGKKTEHILNKAKSIGRAPIFGVSASAGSSAPPPIGTSSASHLGSGNKISTPSAVSEPPHEPMQEEEHDRAGPWKVVPTRRRGRRLRHHPQHENAAAQDTNSDPPRPLQHRTQTQVVAPPPNHLGKLSDSPGQHTDVDPKPIQHGTSGTPRTTFTHRTAPFTCGSRGNHPSPHGRCNRGKQSILRTSHKPSPESNYFSDDKGKFKKRKPATQPNDEDASSDSPG